MKKKYFGTNGIRGIVGELFNPLFITKMGLSIAAFIENKGTVIVGSDARLSSPYIKYGIISTLLGTGIEVIDVGTVPTPLTQFAVKTTGAKLGVMVTASHNPAQFNGLKIISHDGVEIGIKDQYKIENYFEKEQFSFANWEQTKNLTTIDFKDRYINQIMAQVDVEKIKKRNLTAVVDAGNAVGGIITPELLKNMGVRVISVNSHLDGRFPGRDSEPIPNKLCLMAKIAQKTNADFAVAHDGDADRAIFGDGKGNVYWGDKSIAIFEKWVLEREDKKIFVTPVSSSKAMVDIAEILGGKVVWTPVGCIYVSRKMLELNAKLGGEENGGLFYGKHQPVRDGAMAAALMANIIADKQKTMEQLVTQIPEYVQLKDKIHCPNEKKEQVMNSIKNNAPTDNEINTIDGIKIIDDEGWILIRPSGTEAIFRVFVEANTMKKAQDKMKMGKNLVKEALIP